MRWPGKQGGRGGITRFLVRLHDTTRRRTYTHTYAKGTKRRARVCVHLCATEHSGNSVGRSDRVHIGRVRTHVCSIDYLAPPTCTTGAKRAANQARKSASSSTLGGDERRPSATRFSDCRRRAGRFSVFSPFRDRRATVR